MQWLYTAEYVVLYTWDGGLPVERWKIRSVGRDTETSIVVDNTTSDYFVRVQARNSHGFGPKSDVVRFRVAPPSTDRGIVSCSYRLLIYFNDKGPGGH